MGQTILFSNTNIFKLAPSALLAPLDKFLLKQQVSLWHIEFTPSCISHFNTIINFHRLAFAADLFEQSGRQVPANEPGLEVDIGKCTQNVTWVMRTVLQSWEAPLPPTCLHFQPWKPLEWQRELRHPKICRRAGPAAHVHTDLCK